MPRLTFLGAARTVTGSQYLLEAGGERETEAAEALAARITRERGFRTAVPGLGESAELGAG